MILKTTNLRRKLKAFAAEHNKDAICIQEGRDYNSELELKHNETGAWKNSIDATIGGGRTSFSPPALKYWNS